MEQLPLEPFFALVAIDDGLPATEEALTLDRHTRQAIGVAVELVQFRRAQLAIATTELERLIRQIGGNDAIKGM